ncbi:hypothetical protein [Stackebrandtia nassauensis]|uniref:Uncharacterized protein n=1 Tax=Stackebrandtia nassauensis (strain DSM 44728 / CIP 108903 / NRRL B-16338 / NBRC 102104 / LLR-40K-21) TaxID=446470 RepID=D3Q303_STANL|nr:hypothetical protein [Stackebrandtia nassauensis]ADD39973.1 hypothetical protein Snas_0255 [Stackebrandtia nassauensis DSM 44728]
MLGQLFVPKLVDGKRTSRVLALAALLWALGGGLGLQHLGGLWWLIGAGIGVLAAIGNLAAEPARERRLATATERGRPAAWSESGV